MAAAFLLYLSLLATLWFVLDGLFAGLRIRKIEQRLVLQQSPVCGLARNQGLSQREIDEAEQPGEEPS